MLPNIPRNAVKHSGECPQRLKGMRKQGQFKISGNLEYRILHGICSRRQVNNEAAEARSSYKKSYFWWFRNSACGDWTGSNRTEKDRGRVHPGGKGGKGRGVVVWFRVRGATWTNDWTIECWFYWFLFHVWFSVLVKGNGIEFKDKTMSPCFREVKCLSGLKLCLVGNFQIHF